MEVKDKFGVRVGDWAEQVSSGHFKCKFCAPLKVLSFGHGKKDLTQHSESVKHRQQFQSSNNNTSQPSLVDFLHSRKKDDVKLKAWDLENAICLMISRHGYQHTLVACLVEMLQKYVTDSEIVKHLKIGKNKAGYIITHGLGDYFEEETVTMMKSCNAFAASIDESEVNKASQLEVIVTVAGDN